MSDPNTTPEIPEEVDPTDSAWDLEGDDSVGDADDPHRNDQEVQP
jgi:hypothetical protein